MGSTGGRLRTILFTDVQGSTELRSQRGDAFANEILALHEEIVRARIAEHGGESVQFLGDGFLAAFATPEQALACVIAIQRALEQHNLADPERQVHVRSGLHHGEVSTRDGNLYGQAVHAAARVTAEAAGGQILISAAVRDLVAGRVDAPLLDRGLFWLKGFPERWRLYEVQWQDRPVPAAPLVPLPELTPFVEREEERADLRRWVDTARGGRGCLVFVAGEAGVGKTRLVEEVEREAGVLGMRVLVGHCAETGTASPYLPCVEILEQALISPRSPLELRAALGDTAPEIARIVPALRRVLPDIAAPVELPPEQARRYLWNSVLEFLERASRERPLLLVLEDLHWVDESTLLLLEYLAPRLSGMPLLLVGTFRDTEVGVSHPLAALLNQLQRRHLGGRISLRRLTRDGVAGMMRGLADAEPPDELVRAIHAETDGNPFFVEEVYLHLAETGALLDQHGGFRRDLVIAELDVPESIRVVLGGRLSRLSEDTLDTLAAAAVIGRLFETDVAVRVAGRTAEVFADAIDEAERARLIVPDRNDPSRLSFSHELIRQTLVADLSTIRRQRLHERAAKAIEEVHADDLDVHAADLTYHLSRSGPDVDARRLVRYLRVAGRRAYEASAYEEAVHRFSEALALVPADDRETRSDLLEQLALARRSVGQWDEALAAMNEALELYEALAWTDAVGRLCWAMVYQLAWAARFEEAVAVAGRGLAALGELANPDRARLLSATAWVLGLAGDYPTATGMFRQARDLAEDLGDKRALADVLHMETIHLFGYARLAEGVDVGLDAAQVFELEGAVWDLCSVLAFVLYQAGCMGRLEQASTLRAIVGPLAARLGHLGASFLVLADQVRTEGIMRADFAMIEGNAREQIEVCERGGLPWLYVGYLYLGFAAHWRGDWDTAERHLRRAAELEAPGAFSGQGRTHLAVHLAEAGRTEEVLAIAAEQRAALPPPGTVNSLGRWNAITGMVEALYVAGRPDEAAAFLPLVEEAAGLDVSWVAFDGRLLETRAAIAAAAGRRWDAAEEYFRLARGLAASMPNRVEQADVRRFHALMLLDRDGPGDRQGARELLGEAIESYEEIGLARQAATARELLERAS